MFCWAEFPAATVFVFRYCMEFIKTSINNDDLARRVMFFDILAEFLPRLLNSDKKRL